MVGIAVAAVLTLGVFFLGIAVGTLLLVLGLRGRLVPRAPCCAACSQLVGRAEYERSGRCPECGADLRAPDGIRYGQRKRSRGLIVASVLLFLLALIAPMFVALAAPAGRMPRQSGTTAELTATLASQGDPFGFVGSELLQRAGNGTLSDSELSAIVEALRARAPKDFAPDHAHLLALADARGLVPDGAIAEIGDSLFTAPTLPLPETVREGAQLSLGYLGDEVRMDIVRHLRVRSVRAEDDRLPFVSAYDQSELPSVDTNNAPFAMLRIKLPPGQHPLVATYEIAYDFAPGLAGRTPSKQAAATTTLEVTRTVEVVPRDAPPFVKLASPPSKREDVRQACVVNAISIDRDPRDGMCIVRADVAIAPVGGVSIVCDVVLRIDGREIPLGTISAISEDSSSRTTRSLRPVRTECPDPNMTSATVVLVPNPTIREGDPAAQTIWGEEVVLEGIPIRRAAVAEAAP